MHSDDSRAHLRTSTKTNNFVPSVGLTHNNWRAYQAFTDNQNAPSVGLLSPSATPSLLSTVIATGDAHWPMVQQLSNRQGIPGPCEDADLYMLKRSTVQSLDPSHIMAPDYDLSSSLLANEKASYEFDNWHLGQQCSFESPLMAGTLTAPAYDKSPLPLAREATSMAGSWDLDHQHSLSPLPVIPPSCVSSATSRPYRCLSCSDTPTFNSQKDYDRHLLAKAHWNDVTQFYRCCCRAQSPRKDHHRRHLSICDGLAHNLYACKCGVECSSQYEHTKHIEDCGRRRRRRREQPTA